MDHHGFIREQLDIKLLILYTLDRLPGAIEAAALSDLVLFDGGFTWFDYTDCLAALVESGHVAEAEGRYEITESGHRSVELIGGSLPFSVRAKADRLTTPVAARMRRSSMIETAVERDKDGAVFLELRLSDGVGEIISMRIAAPDGAQAEAMEKRFRKDAEKLYNQILELLIGE